MEDVDYTIKVFKEIAVKLKEGYYDESFKDLIVE
jgi:hypothetical protein